MRKSESIIRDALAGDTTMALAEIICQLGCDKCRELD